ncbi:MAG: 16S rRNA (guanine(527)-N(7))-methyltransferase RsmG [Bacteroidales bacterium]|nr:16S rRNA (guanine(527)-N(7))-methyltransferase RsmG [Bacteroidales bacterium]
MDILHKYFPNLTPLQIHQYGQLFELYQFWNQRINLISRKDIEFLYERHVLHSLAIAKVFTFSQHDTILDVGTGGGFPGIPLAIMFPQAHFSLIDSIGKKIMVVNDIVHKLNLTNVKAEHINAKQKQGEYTYIISRAVCETKEFLNLTKKNIIPGTSKIILLKGGHLNHELASIKHKIVIIDIAKYFEESFFETKKIVILHG